jgi:AcrR family transcriptional regulator
MPKVSESYLEAHREKILDAATTCFSHKGFSETTIPDICHEAQLSTGALYRYFLSKEEIIEACVQKHRADRSKRLKLVEENENVQEMLGNLFQQQALRLRSPEPDSRAKIMIHSFGEALTNLQVSNIVKENWVEMNSRLEKIMRKAQETGYLDPSLDAKAVAVLLNALHDGLLLQKVIDPDSRGVLEDALEAMRTIFTSGHNKPPSGERGGG